MFLVLIFLTHSIGGIILKVMLYRVYSKIIYMRLITGVLACISVGFIFVNQLSGVIIMFVFCILNEIIVSILIYKFEVRKIKYNLRIEK
jgi:hypothetical protein